MESFMFAPVGCFGRGAGDADSCCAEHMVASIATGGVGGNREFDRRAVRGEKQKEQERNRRTDNAEIAEVRRAVGTVECQPQSVNRGSVNRGVVVLMSSAYDLFRT